MNHFKVFTKYAAGSFLALIVGFFATTILTRLIPKEEMGKYSLFITVGGLVASFAYLGLDQSYVRFYFDEAEGARRNLLRRCLFLPVLVTAGVSGLLLLGSGIFSEYVIGESSFLLTLLFCAYLLGLVLDRFILMELRMEQQASAYSALNIIRKALYLLLAVLMYLSLTGELSWSLTIPVTIAEFAVIAGALLVRKRKSREKTEACGTSLRQLLIYGYPFIFSTTITILFHSTDKFMLKGLTDYSEVGLYTGAQNIVNLISQVQTVFSTFWVPVAFEHFSKKPEDKDFYIRVNRIVSCGMLLIFVLILAMKDVIIYFLGSDYREASYIFPFLAFMPIMYTVSETTVLGINFMKKSGYHVWISLACAIANLIGNYFLIRAYGAVGAAVSTGIAYILFFALRTILAGKVYPVKYDTLRFVIAFLPVAGLALLASFFPVTWWYLGLAALAMVWVAGLYRETIAWCLGRFRTSLRNRKKKNRKN